MPCRYGTPTGRPRSWTDSQDSGQHSSPPVLEQPAGATQLDPGDEEREALEDWEAQKAFEAQRVAQEQQHDESESEYYEDPAEVSLYGCHNDRQTRTTQGRGRKTRGKLRSSTRAQQAAED